VTVTKQEWTVMPNPATDILRFEYEGNNDAAYRITDVRGNTVQQGSVLNRHTIDISRLIPGLYFVNLVNNGISGAPQKIIKL